VESAQTVFAFVEKNEKRIKDITVKLQRLLEGYLDQDIDKETYREEKAKLLSEKKSLEEEISKNQQKQKHWLEPMQKWIKDAQNMEKNCIGFRPF
jgi:predicted nucleotidyltransferase